MVAPYTRKHSNEIAASDDGRLHQLRKLQSQLSVMIQDSQGDPLSDEESVCVDLESATDSSWEEFSALLRQNADDIESGPSITLCKPKLQRMSAKPPPIELIRHSEISIGETKSITDEDTADCTASVSADGSKLDSSSRSTLDSSSRSTLDSSYSSRISSTIDSSYSSRMSHRWSRPGSSRSISRSLSRQRSFSRARSFSFKTNSSSKCGDISLSKKQRLPNYDFLSKENEDKGKSSLLPSAKWWHGVFLFSFIALLACLITLWAPYPMGARMSSEDVAKMPWSNGCQGGLSSCICPRETVCADDLRSMIFLTIARSMAWFDYPLYMLLFLSKAKNLNNFLQRTLASMWINFSDYHRVHSLFGIWVGVESTMHAFFHTLRWALRHDDLRLLWTSQTGITGLVAVAICPFIVLPMTVPFLKARMSFEWRKGLHYLSILWGIALMFHAPQRIFWLIGIPIFIYTADKLAEALFKTHLIESAYFERLGDTSCIISFKNPPGFGTQNSAYVYLMLPWLSKYQFHAFTVFPGTRPNSSSICIHKCGDWTQELMKKITAPTHKAAFVVGPFLSPFSSPAMESENLVAVATGIGVTPAISLMKQYSSTSRRLNLVWICRDAGLVEHFLETVEFCSDGYTLIYYTGERRLVMRNDLPPAVFVFNGRPNLERAISGIIASIATGEGLPEELQRKVLTRTPAEMRSKLLLEKALSIYSMDQLYNYTVKASNNEGMEPLVSNRGVLSTFKHLLGSDINTAMITNNFDKLDTDSDGKLDREEFELLFNLMMAVDTDTHDVANVKHGLQRMNLFESIRHIDNSESEQCKDEFRIKKHLQGDDSASNWNLLYCGGSQSVLDQLKKFKHKFGVGLSVEKFHW